jgi:tripartite ATP-independent transporter DctP family solute receptor
MNFRSPRKASIALMALASASMLAIAGCSSGNSGGGDDAEITLRLGHVYEANHPVETCGIETLNKELKGSGIKIESYPAGQLASEAESLEQVSTGSIDIAIAGASFLGTWYKPIAVLDAGYVFDDADHFTEAVNGKLIQGEFDKLAEKSGLRVQSSWYYGTREVTANKAISGPEDMKGVKIRTPDAPMYLKNIKLMGGTATPMALGEVYLGLQQGVIDAQENPIPTIATSKLNEVQKYLNMTDHMVQGVFLTTQESLTDSWSDEQKTAFSKALDKASESVHDCIVKDEQETLEKWKKDGSIEINEDVEQDEFAKVAQKEFAKNPDFGDLYTKIRDQK